MIEMPIFKDVSSNFQYSIQIENKIITLKYVYNSRSGYWHIDFVHRDYALKGIKIVKKYPLTRQYKILFPVLSGDFFLLNRTEEKEFTYENFGIDWSVFYLTKEEVSKII